MKRFLLSLSLFFALSLAYGQTSYDIIVSGQVTEVGTNNPVTGYPVFILLDSSNSPLGSGRPHYANTVNTDANGNWVDTVRVPNQVTCGTIRTYTWDCQSNLHALYSNFCPNPLAFSNLDFNICVQSVFGPARLTGNVLYDNAAPARPPIDHGRAFLIVHDTVAQTLTAIDTVVLDSNGYYFFDSLMPGEYLIKAALLPASSQYWNYIPTYYGNVLTWDSASVVTVPNNMILNPILLKSGTNPGGPGFVGGLISQGANKVSAGPGDPLGNVQVMVLDMNNSPVQYTYSDGAGNFSISNLAYGTYKIWAEVPGRVTYPAIITLDANNSSIPDLDLIVNYSEIITTLSPGTPAAWTAANIYPNPNTGVFDIGFELKQSEIIKIELKDLQGRIILSREIPGAKGRNKVNFHENLPAGMYLVTLQSSEGVATLRMNRQ